MEGEGDQITEIDSETVSSSDIFVGDERTLQWLVVLICCVVWFLGYLVFGTLLCHFFLGHILLLQWLLLCIGLPIPFLPIILDPQNRISIATVIFILGCGFLGLMAVKISALYPVMALLCVLSLLFGALFTFLLYKHGIIPSSLNLIVILLGSAVVSGIWSCGERARGESRSRFISGSVFAILICGINGLLLSLASLAFQNLYIIFVSLSYALVVSALICVARLLIKGDFEHMILEGGRSVTETLGYWITFACNVVAWQTFFLATVGLVYLAYSLFSNANSTVPM